MIKFLKNNFLLTLITLIISMLLKIAIPLSAIIEQKMIDYIIGGDMSHFHHWLLIAGIITIFTAVFYLLNALTEKKVKVLLEMQLRNDVFNGIINMDYAEFNNKDTSKWLNYIKNYTSTIANNFTHPIFTLISYGTMAIIILTIMFYYNYMLAIFSIACATLSIILPLIFNKKLATQLKSKLDADANLTFQIKEVLNGHELINSLNIIKPFQNRYITSSQHVAKTNYNMEITISLLENVSNVIQKIIWFTSFLIAGKMVLSGAITVGTLVMFIKLFGEFNGCVTLYSQVIPILCSTRPTIKELTSFMNYNNGKENDVLTPKFERKISIKALSFAYDQREILNNLNLSINKNEKIAIIGKSGCGKTTLIKLLNGYYSNYAGQILYDTSELRKINKTALNQLINIIHQNTYIFNDTVRFNICFNGNFSEKELQRALDLSGVSKFLEELPNSLDSICGENGSLLSGGQRQRIALARALIRNAQILILDESVSAIDVSTANEIENEILNLKNMTVISVTHRIKDGLLNKYDRIYVLENGSLHETNI